MFLYQFTKKTLCCQFGQLSTCTFDFNQLSSTIKYDFLKLKIHLNHLGSPLHYLSCYHQLYFHSCQYHYPQSPPFSPSSFFSDFGKLFLIGWNQNYKCSIDRIDNRGGFLRNWQELFLHVHVRRWAGAWLGSKIMI